jgi:hypothetical protein
MTYDGQPLACLRIFVWILAALTLACGGGGSPTGPSGSGGSGSGSGSGPGGTGGTGGSGGTPNRGTVTAFIDGVAYTGIVNSANFNQSGNVNLASNNSALTLSINFAARGAVGTTTINPTSTTVLNVITTTGTTVIGSWSASGLGGSGTLTIATLTSSGMSGTFSFTAVPASAGTTGTKTVTDGTFTATF